MPDPEWGLTPFPFRRPCRWVAASGRVVIPLVYDPVLLLLQIGLVVLSHLVAIPRSSHVLPGMAVLVPMLPIGDFLDNWLLAEATLFAGMALIALVSTVRYLQRLVRGEDLRIGAAVPRGWWVIGQMVWLLVLIGAWTAVLELMRRG
jgi:hypothetical protein